MSYEAKFKQGDLIVAEFGATAVVKFAEPDREGYILVNVANNPDSEKEWEFAHQDQWTKVRQIPERWLVFGSSVGAEWDDWMCEYLSLEAARNYTTDNTIGILHVRKDGTTEWLDIEEEDR